MGYHIEYSLTVFDRAGNKNTEMIERLIAQRKGAHFAINNYGKTIGATSQWYHGVEMLRFSEENPEYVFELSCQGEEGLPYKIYYKGGKSQVCRATLSYASYDESKLS